MKTTKHNGWAFAPRFRDLRSASKRRKALQKGSLSVGRGRCLQNGVFSIPNNVIIYMLKFLSMTLQK